MRPSGVCVSSCLQKSLSANPPARSPSVSTIPGLMAFTRMLRGAQLFGQRSGHGMA